MPGSKLPPLTAIRAFEAAGRLGTFAAAAGELGVTPSAVSHQVAALERHLGLRLFKRNGRRIALSGAGETYLRQVGDCLDRLGAATASLRDGSAQTALTVLCAPSFASKWLLPRIDTFVAAHPEWQVRIVASTARSLTSDADVGIFYGQPDDPGLATEPIVRERLVVLCSPMLLERGAPLAAPGDITRHVLIEANNRRVWKNWLDMHGLGASDVRTMMSVERSLFAIDAAVRGVGIILESDFLAAEEIADGRLVAPFGDRENANIEDAYFLASRGTAQDGSPVEAFSDWVRRETGLERPPDI